MTRRRLLPALGIALIAPLAERPLVAQSAAAPERAIRRTVPITNSIRRAYVAGTRDSSGRPGRNYWQLKTDYVIAVRLDPGTQRLSGRETITLHNTSPDTLRQIVLRLPANIFLPHTPKSASWMIAEATDGMRLTRMAIDGRAVTIPDSGSQGARLTAGLSRGGLPPTEPRLTGSQSTIASLMLATPIAPGARAALDIEWNHKLPGGPGVGHRMTQRWADSLFQPTQWFPRVAVYDDLRGWDTELYLGPSEFYNGFGRYDVSIDVPAGWLVSGTGLLQNAADVLTPMVRERVARITSSDSLQVIVGIDERGIGKATTAGDANGRLVWRFVADNVNDFAWATSRAFVWRATRATIPTKGPVPIHLLHLPGRASMFDKAGPVTRHALEFYSALWFPYQFPQLTLQDGPSSGMEYPMVINSNVGAADHETGHQWWPMVVANNETWYGWMDEGFNQYMNILSDADAAKAPPVLDKLGASYGRFSGSESEPPMMWNANYAGPASYGFTTYSKTPLMLSMLGAIVGDSAVQRAQREFAAAWLFKHPSPWDWAFAMERSLGRDLGWFWYAWLFTTERVDGSIRAATLTGARPTVTVRQDGEMPSPVVLRVTVAPTGGALRWPKNAVVIDSVTADLTWPVDVWFRGSRTFVAPIAVGGRRIERVRWDPACRFPDRDASDNGWPRGEGIPAASCN
jgi:hypothetical protein